MYHLVMSIETEKKNDLNNYQSYKELIPVGSAGRPVYLVF